MVSPFPNAPPDAVEHRGELARFAKDAVLKAGFDRVGIAPATPGLGAERLSDWIAADKQGDMDYMVRHQEARGDPAFLLPGVRSVIVAALNYMRTEAASAKKGEARISRYAWGRDYHDVLRAKLQSAAAKIQLLAPTEQFRAVVDSAPLMERDYARMAGLGWFGKNTLLLSRGLGSFFFLGAILTTAELEPDVPFEADHCGSCSKCLDACPTNAFAGPYDLDPRRCISYLTIEHRGRIDDELAAGMGDWTFGCDVCQDVCPWNRKTPFSNVDEFRPSPDLNPLSLSATLAMTEAEFRTRFRGTPLFRAKRYRLVRNALVVAVNQRLTKLLPAIASLRDDENAVVRETAAWATERLQAICRGEAFGESVMQVRPPS